MAKRWNKVEIAVGLVVAGIGGVILLVAGLWIYVSATTKPLHPSAQDVPTASGPGSAQRWQASIDRARATVRAAVAEQNLPGLSIAVGVNNEIAWSEGFGYADIDQRSTVTPATRFRIGTISIPLTATAAGLLIDRKALNLDEEIQAHVPDFPKKKWPVTLRQVMGHVAGLTSDGGDEGPLLGKHCDRPVDALSEFANRDLSFEPGTAYRYSRYGFILVSAAIEAAADDDLYRFMRKEIFDPLGMNDTLADSTTETIDDRAVSYFPRFAADPRYGPDPMRPVDYSCYAGSSVFMSTPADLVRFGMAMNAGKLLQRSTIDLLQTSLRLPSGEDTGYGLGWDLETVALNGQQVRVVGHDGDLLGGIAATLMLFRDRGLVIAVVSNTSYADTPGLATKVADAFTISAR